MLLKGLLYPFSLLYSLVMQVRNHLYDSGLKPSAVFNLPVIGVGNLTVGGTGKSPMVEYLIRLLHTQFRVAVVSRGYGRDTKGYRRVTSEENASTVGDEPFQFYKKFKDHITVAVGEERALAIPLVLHDVPDINVVILDDAFQHRRVKPSMSILLCDYHRPFYDDLLLPAGRLREPSQGANRADMVVVTKCPPDLRDDDFMRIEKSIRNVANKPVFFTAIDYGVPVAFAQHELQSNGNVLLVTGIANSQPLLNYVKGHYKLLAHFAFGDHHKYTMNDLKKIEEFVKKNSEASVLTTEKDMVKLNVAEFSPFIKHVPFFYIPITVQFLRGENDFDQIILSHVQRGE